MRRRSLKIVLAIALFLGFCTGFALYNKWRIVAWYAGLPAPRYSVKLRQDIKIPMRDGIKLSADLYIPDAEGKYPVILVRTMYGKRTANQKYSLIASVFASQGYVAVVQDVRGKFDSEGEFYPYVNEANDGYDTIEWAGTQSFSTGKVGTFGFSYWGSTQWLPAPLGSKYLKAMVPVVTSQDLYQRWAYNGIYRLTDILVWYYANAPKRAQSEKGVDWNTALRKLPLIEADNALGIDVPAYDDWIRNPQPGPYWDKIRVDDKIGQITAPALIVDGWYDYYVNLAIGDYNRMIKNAGTDDAKRSMIMIGPWTHFAESKFKDADFGREASFFKNFRLIVLWFDYWLKGEQNGIYSEGPIRIFTLGANTWRAVPEWPLKNTRYTAYYLHSQGKANTARGDGELSTVEPGAETPDAFTSDPENPVPSIGGTAVLGDLKAGPADQRTVEARDDVLVYTSAPLAAELELTGPVKLIFHAASSAKDTDFAVKLTEVDAAGKSVSIQTAVLRARYRESLAQPSLLENGKIYRFELEIGNTSILLKKNHRIRLQIAGSNFPEYGRNLNTGADNGTTTEVLKARQLVYHDREHPSQLILPVIPTAQ